MNVTLWSPFKWCGRIVPLTGGAWRRGARAHPKVGWNTISALGVEGIGSKINLISILTSFLVGALPESVANAQPLLDFGDAAGYPVVSHAAVNQEWLAASPTGTTTAEPAPLAVDFDDAGMILFCLAPAMGGVCPGAVAIPVGVDASAPAGLRFLNVVADLNGNGVFGDIVPLVEHLVQDIAVQVKPGAFAWVVVVGYPIRVGPVWVRATLTRNPIGVQNWNGANIGGVPFAFGETEDVLSLTPLFPPPPLAKKKCLGDKMPKLVRVRPNYIRSWLVPSRCLRG